MNRLRFLALFSMVFLLTALARGETEPTLLTAAVSSVGTRVGTALDMPLSPLRLLIASLAEDADVAEAVRTAAGLCGLVAGLAVTTFAAWARFLGWPGRRRAFNVWINLPLFDPAVGGDVPAQLRRDARFNMAFGLVLPYVIPVVVKLAGLLIHPVSLANPQTLIWTVTAWVFLPASMIMRGLALGRIADMIERQSRRTRAARGTLNPQTA